MWKSSVLTVPWWQGFYLNVALIICMSNASKFDSLMSSCPLAHDTCINLYRWGAMSDRPTGNARIDRPCSDALFCFLDVVGHSVCCANTWRTICVALPRYDPSVSESLFVTERLVTQLPRAFNEATHRGIHQLIVLSNTAPETPLSMS